MTGPTKNQTPTGHKPKSLVATAESMDDLLALMDGSDDDGKPATALTLLLFHAHYCKICQRATMQLPRVAKEYPSVKFAKVEARVFPEPSADNLRSLGVSKFPFVQIFKGGDCVASFSTGAGLPDKRFSKGNRK